VGNSRRFARIRGKADGLYDVVENSLKAQGGQVLLAWSRSEVFGN